MSHSTQKRGHESCDVSSIILYIKIILSNKEFQESLICGNFKIKSAFNALFISKILDNWEERKEDSGDEI